MWTVTLTHPSGSTVSAQAATRADARRWAQQYRAIDDRVTITAPVSLVKVSS